MANPIEKALTRNVLFRGTTDYLYEVRKKAESSYFGIGRENKITFTSLSFFDACSAAVQRAKQYEQKPILLAINNVRKYADRLKSGIETQEIEIHGPIELSDVQHISSMDDLCNILEKLEKKKLLTSEEEKVLVPHLRYFQEKLTPAHVLSLSPLS